MKTISKIEKNESRGSGVSGDRNGDRLSKGNEKVGYQVPKVIPAVKIEVVPDVKSERVEKLLEGVEKREIPADKKVENLKVENLKVENQGENDQKIEEDAKSTTSTDILASSNLFFVLQKLLMSDDGGNLVDELQGVNRSLHSIAVSASRIAKALEIAGLERQRKPVRDDRDVERVEKGERVERVEVEKGDRGERGESNRRRRKKSKKRRSLE